MYNPQELPEVDKVAVLVLGQREDEGESRLYTIKDGFLIVAEVIIEDANITKIVDLWRQLPQHEQDRCHFPPFGLRFFQNNTQLLEASICWECNNIWINLHDEADGYNFDARSNPAQQLFALLKQLSGQG